MNIGRLTLVAAGAALAGVIVPNLAYSQTRGLERRLERNAEQLQRQVNRSNYYSPKAWQQIAPWVRENRVAELPALAAAGNAVKETVDAATRVGDGSFGFRDKAEDNGWFYDYYTFAPTYYVPKDENSYAGAIRYYDSDGDGVYDSQAFYRDSDNDGKYDEYDRIDFYVRSGKSDSAEEVTAVEVHDDHHALLAPADARRYMVEGEIVVAKAATVNGTENLLIGVKHTDKTLAIDLGPVVYLKDKNVEVGKDIVAVGAMEHVGEKDVLIADSFRIEGGPTVRIERRVTLEFTGQIIAVERVIVGSSENLMAVVEVDGNRQLVDLGALTFNPSELEPTTKIVVWGVPVRVDSHRVILAQHVQLNGNVVRVKRF